MSQSKCTNTQLVNKKQHSVSLSAEELSRRMQQVNQVIDGESIGCIAIGSGGQAHCVTYPEGYAYEE